ncbi:Dabb family protein [Microbacterium sp. W1N]|uniref:Dabb family protein n=1 Tax=Microbacterium festucae TaxID=2977531 RepID=UPI0021BFBFED|nr:Dabb family protein [Microbacterium festucae]MCT9819039.1 Dabb family protein [Microbacterium festucae]
MAYRHVVLFRVRDGVGRDDVDKLIDALRELSSLPGVTHWRIERSLDQRKGTIIVEEATFVDQRAFDNFRAHPAHIAAATLASGISDWCVGDYLE